MSKTNWKFALSIYSTAIIGALLAYGYEFPSSNLIQHIPYLQAILDNDLYQRDFYVQEALKFSPRYYYQYLMILPSKFGISLPLTYFIYYVITFTSFILGLFAIGKKLGKSKISAISLAFLSLLTVDGTVGYVDLFRPEPIPAILAMGITIWGIYFCFCKRWILGYFLFGLACLLQFLIGILPAFMFTPILLLEAGKKKNFKFQTIALLILFGFASLIYLPMVFTGSGGTVELSDQEFVYIYGHIRHPHHFIFSTFDPIKWRDFFLFILSGLLLIKASETLSSEHKFTLRIIIITLLLFLLLGYVFVEIYPLSFITKLQLARTTPFAQLMVLIVISTLIAEYYKKKNLAISLLLLVIPTLYSGSLILLVISILIVTNKLQFFPSKSATFICILGAIMLFFIYPLPSLNIDTFKLTIWKLILFASLAFPFVLTIFYPSKRFTRSSIYAFSLIIFSIFIMKVFEVLPKRIFSTFQGRIKIERVWNNDITKLALRFRERSSQDALILIPPSEQDFRLYSQRAVVLTFKGFPFTDAGIKEWMNRLETILGSVKPPVTLANVDLMYRQQSGAHLVKTARRYRAEYILTKAEWHSDIQGKIFDREGEWVIYQIM